LRNILEWFHELYHTVKVKVYMYMYVSALHGMSNRKW